MSKASIYKALWLSIILHVAIVAFLFLGDFSSHEKPKPVAQEMKPIQAVVIDKIKKTKSDALAADIKRVKDIEKRVTQAKTKRAREEARIKKLERQRKKKEKEKIAADKAAKSSIAKAAQADKIRKQKEQEKQKADEAAAKSRSKRLKEEAATKKAQELRQKKIADRKRKEKEAKDRAKQDQLIAQQMAAEMASRNKARRQQMMSEIQRFAALITNIIDQNMINDRSTMEGKSCKLIISLAPSGFVTQVRVKTGDGVVCEAAKRAIYKAGTLPVSKDPQVFKEMRNIDVTVVPEF